MFEFIKKIFRRKTMNEAVELSEVELVIQEYLRSAEYRNKLDGDRYYRGEHDILKRKRTAIGEGGHLTEVENLPNNKIIDNQYKKLVKQKVNYILSKAPTISSENEAFEETLSKILDKNFLRTMKRIGTDVYNNGVVWMYVYCDNTGEIQFKKLNSVEVIPVWTDNDHTELKYAIRLFTTREFKGGRFEDKINAEIYTLGGIELYTFDNMKLKPQGKTSYLNMNGEGYNWEKIPLICFRADELEQPLLKRVKSLQDALNELLSDFMNNMQEDKRNTILIIRNYDGENLGEFRRNLATYGAVKVREEGDVNTLQVEVNAANYEAITKLIKKTIIENGGGFDSKADVLGNNPNQLNIRSMYSEIDLEANDLETEFQASFEDLIWFVTNHLKNTGQGDYLNERADFILNRDILVNESQAIMDIRNSVGILSHETLIEQHPWVSDTKAEMDKIENEQAETEYGGLGGEERPHGTHE